MPRRPADELSASEPADIQTHPAKYGSASGGRSSNRQQGGENYRAFQFLADDAGNFDPHMQKLWEVTERCCDMQVEMQKEGVTCSSIAYAIHKYQVEQGVQNYIYHRPAHGQGSEGHQPPYMALGDSTVLKRNMTFSEEPRVSAQTENALRIQLERLRGDWRKIGISHEPCSLFERMVFDQVLVIDLERAAHAAAIPKQNPN